MAEIETTPIFKSTLKTSTKAAVIGKPIEHSLSPAIFTFLATSHSDVISKARAIRFSPSFDFEYSSKEVAPAELPAYLQDFRKDPDWMGLNVTIPHKEAVLSYLDELSPEVQITGAANVIHKGHEKSHTTLTGHNTDIQGILMTLRTHSNLHGPFAGKRAWVVGAGGAARAVLYALGELKFGQVDLMNRTPERARHLIEQMKQVFPSTEWKMATTDFELGAPFALCVNATPVGMSNKSQNRDKALERDHENFIHFNEIFRAFGQSKNAAQHRFEKNAVAFDLIYRPEDTPFLKIARTHGLTPVGGLEMLVEQALAAWKIWFGPSQSVDNQKGPLLSFLRNRPLFLTGCMGAGKSTVGEILSRRLSRTFVDLDRAIESRENKTIEEIFTEKGEPVFRELEFKEFQRHFLLPNTVLALGGGTLLHPSIRALIQKVGTLIYLKSSPEILTQRIMNQNHYQTDLNGNYQNYRQDHQRPLLAGLSPQQQIFKIKALLKDRESFYLQAPVQINTDSLSPEEIASRICDLIEC